MVNGTNLTGTAQFKFALVNGSGTQTFWSFNGSGGGNAEPADPPISLAVNRGVFSVNLGDLSVSNMTASIPASVFTNSEVYLRTWVNEGANGMQQLVPDRRITAVGYAMTAANVVGSVGQATNFTGTLSGDVIGTQTSTLVIHVLGIPAADVVRGALAANQAGSVNNPQTIVRRDAGGGFTAGTVVGKFVGDGSGLTNLNIAAVETSVAPGVTVVSTVAQDENLLTKGYQPVMAVQPPAWVNGTSVNAPSARTKATAVWDGQRMVVWGGSVGAGVYVNTGGIYHPNGDIWEDVSTVSAPSARGGHTALWSGSVMIVWGGVGANGYLATGGRLQIDPQVWNSIADSGGPSARVGQASAWTGSRMLIWGGQGDSGLLNDGGLYDPVTNQWTPLPSGSPLAARTGAVAVWAGDRVLIWGGEGNNGPLNSGAQLRFLPNGLPSEWTAMNSAGAPTARRWHSSVWTGSRMVVWGGEQNGAPLGNGASYDPVTDTWATLTIGGAPAPRYNHSAFWTGGQVVVLGGTTGSADLATGAAYDPFTQQWNPLSSSGSPVARSGAASVWTGTEVLVFGGTSGGQAVGSLQRLVPQPVWYFYRKL